MRSRKCNEIPQMTKGMASDLRQLRVAQCTPHGGTRNLYSTTCELPKHPVELTHIGYSLQFTQYADGRQREEHEMKNNNCGWMAMIMINLTHSPPQHA